MISSRSPLTRLALLATFAFSSFISATLTLSPNCSAQDAKLKPIRALLVLGGCCHDYAVQKELLSKGISERAHVEVTFAHDPDTSTKHLNPIYESAAWADGYDVIIHDECSSDVKDLAVIDRILEPHRKGLPAVILHCGMHSYRSEGYPKAITPWFEFTGLQSTGHGPQAPIDIELLPQSSPIAEGQPNWTTINEELYNNSEGKLVDTAKPIAMGTQKFKDKKGVETATECVVVWTNEYRKTTKVFATTLGHNNGTVGDARYLDLVTRGLLWSCGKLNSDYLKKK
jgi:type 1 glutamine amidotransferase